MTADSTISYYNTNAKAFVGNTLHVDFTHMQKIFCELLSPHSFILDFGCGSGRDTKFFLDKGFRVDAIDGSIELCRLASEYTGIQVRHMFFQELDAVNKYDGIWACSSILHLNKEDLSIVIKKMANALKSNGYIYTSFKYGTFSGKRNGRFFTDLTEQSFDELLKDIPELHVIKAWTTSDVRPGRGEEKWLNLILQKTE